MNIVSTAPTPPIAALRAQVARLEGYDPGGAGPAPLRLGIPALDGALPGGGLARGALHEIAGTHVLDAAPLGFCLAWLAALGADDGPVLWLQRHDGGALPDLCGHGLAARGLDPGRLLFARPRHGRDLLWAAEESARSATLGAVVVESAELALTASRRLQLAAEAAGTPLFLLRPVLGAAHPLAAATRWRVAGAPSSPHGVSRWRVALERCRGGTPRTWLVERDDATGDLAVVSDATDRPARPDAARLAG